jgi:hypothetical protein
MATGSPSPYLMQSAVTRNAGTSAFSIASTLDVDDILGLIDAPIAFVVFEREPLFADHDNDRVALSNLVVDQLAKVDPAVGAGHVEVDSFLSEGIDQMGIESSRGVGIVGAAVAEE